MLVKREGTHAQGVGKNAQKRSQVALICDSTGRHDSRTHLDYHRVSRSWLPNLQALPECLTYSKQHWVTAKSGAISCGCVREMWLLWEVPETSARI
jgi:hypothetical protein